MLPIYSNDPSNKLKSLRIKEKIQGWLRLIFSDKDSRNLFLFLILNLSFAFVELLYGVWTNSLGLISDAFHMFFDCSALVAGLVASIITKWRADEKFSYGYVRAEILAGFVNGIFLVFVAFFIFTEAVERAFEPPEVKHDRLLVISVLGLLVNLVGIFVFQHGGTHHGHSHGHSHGHQHHHHQSSDTSQNVNSSDQFSFVTANGHNPIGHGHSHEHGHSHGHSHSHNGTGGPNGPSNHIMKGVFLHVMADTLGSVGVIISALLMSNFGLMIADPICSMFIAILVLFSVYPLLRDSVSVLMQRSPSELDETLSNCYRRVMELEGVLSIQDAHFWTLCSGTYVGAFKVEVNQRANPRTVLSHCQSIFHQVGIKSLHVQIDYV